MRSRRQRPWPLPGLRRAQGGAKASRSCSRPRATPRTGTATFTQQAGKVLVEVKVSGLAPGAEHGFHIHEKGDCSAGDGMSAGGHFNPLSKPHAHFSTTDRHAGDMPALKADASGNASGAVELDVITVTDGPTEHRRPGADRPRAAGRLQDAADRQRRRARRLRGDPEGLRRGAQAPSTISRLKSAAPRRCSRAARYSGES